jgi:hypothetical protein
MLALTKDGNFIIKDGRLIVIPDGKTADECECCLGCPPRCSRPSGGSYYPIEHVKEAQLSVAFSDTWKETYDSNLDQQMCDDYWNNGFYYITTSNRNLNFQITISGLSALNGTYLSIKEDLSSRVLVEGCTRNLYNLCRYVFDGASQSPTTDFNQCYIYPETTDTNPCNPARLAIYHAPVPITGSIRRSADSSFVDEFGNTGTSDFLETYDLQGFAFFTLSPKDVCTTFTYPYVCRYNYGITDSCPDEMIYSLDLHIYYRAVNGYSRFYTNSWNQGENLVEYEGFHNNKSAVVTLSGDPNSYWHTQYLIRRDTANCQADYSLYGLDWASWLNRHLTSNTQTAIGLPYIDRPYSFCEDPDCYECRCRREVYSRNSYNCEDTGPITILDSSIPSDSYSCSFDSGEGEAFNCPDRVIYSQSTGTYTTSGLSMQADLVRS